MKSIVQLTSLLCVFLCASFQAHSQSADEFVPYTATVGIQAGTQGLGVTAAMPFSQKLGARVGVSFLPFNTNVNATYGDYATKSDVEARFSNVHLVFDWTPLYAKQNFFRHFTLSAGGGFFFQADGDFTTRLTEPYFYGEIEVAPEDIGTLTTNISWKNSIAPYASVGFTQIKLAPVIDFGVTLGAYYLDAPSVNMEGTDLLVGNEVNGPIIQENAKDYRFLPVLQISFSYKIK